MLRENVLRAPEPVGVPAPQVVVYREVVLALSAYGLVVDVFVRVIAGVGRGIGEGSQGDEKLPGIENGAVYEVGFPRFQSSLQLAEKRVRRIKGQMLKAHKGLHRHGFRLDAQCVAQRAVGVREAEEKIGMLVVGSAGDDAAVAEQDFDL